MSCLNNAILNQNNFNNNNLSYNKPYGLNTYKNNFNNNLNNFDNKNINSYNYKENTFNNNLNNFNNKNIGFNNNLNNFDNKNINSYNYKENTFNNNLNNFDNKNIGFNNNLNNFDNKNIGFNNNLNNFGNKNSNSYYNGSNLKEKIELISNLIEQNELANNSDFNINGIYGDNLGSINNKNFNINGEYSNSNINFANNELDYINKIDNKGFNNIGIDGGNFDNINGIDNKVFSSNGINNNLVNSNEIGSGNFDNINGIDNRGFKSDGMDKNNLVNSDGMNNREFNSTEIDNRVFNNIGIDGGNLDNYKKEFENNNCYGANDCNNCNNSCYKKCDGCDIIKSIALQETAMSHILNAEGEKIQNAIKNNCSIKDLLCINYSVANTIQEITFLEMVLFNKLKAVVDNPCKPTPLPPPKPCIGQIKVIVKDCNCGKPLTNAKICIYKNHMLVDSGYTNCCGIYESKLLCCGKYIIKISYLNCAEQIACIDIIKPNHCYKLEVCFNVPEYKKVFISGCIYNNCCKPICNAKVTAIGKNILTTYTDRCGYFEISGIIACDSLSLKIDAKCCMPYFHIFNEPLKCRYKVNAYLTC